MSGIEVKQKFQALKSIINFESHTNLFMIFKHKM